MTIEFGPQVCGSLAEGGDREWLVADGRGGYAMGTASGLRTRRYHGLLVVPAGGARRMLALAALDPVVVLPSGARVPLGVHEWASGAVAPAGHALLESFALVDGLPRWRWRIGDVVIERELAMRHGRSSVAVAHRLLAGAAVTLELEALCTWRDAHSERHAYGSPDVVPSADGAVVEGSYRLSGPGWRPGGQWYLGVFARREAERGLSAAEDVWSAGRFVHTLEAGRPMEVSAWAGDLASAPPPASVVIAGSHARAAQVIATAAYDSAAAYDGVDATLALAADAFVVDGPDVVAGYPWFGSWSRDTMTSYEGLFLETGRTDEGRALLVRYAGTLSEGMLANTADTGATEYNTADATMWFVHAAGRHLLRTGDTDLAVELLPALGQIVDAHVAGTRYGIRVDPADGLLTQGEPGLALTWMDARVDGTGVTPRIGKPIEINALWADGLDAITAARRAAGKDGTYLAGLAERARASLSRFRSSSGQLYDVIDGPDGPDRALRPNQLIASGLVDLDGVDSAAVQRLVASELLTPIGLRSLSPGSAAYRGRHRGGPAERDRAYHQGTVWPWLIGPYVDASIRAGRPVDGVLDGLVRHLGEWGLGSVSETADGDAPHQGTGCPFQAWSVAEFLRARRALAKRI